MRISDWSSDVCSSDLSFLRAFVGNTDDIPEGHDDPQKEEDQQEPGRRTEKPVKKPANQCATGDSPDQFRQHAITEAVSLIHPLLRAARHEIGRAHVCTPVTHAHLVSTLLLKKHQ